ncbi:hypothetical protein FGB62_94g038 [Gracilaria domingensis]|nr:hypothetical protein FGB62_94g038 [Gracilaria domingensis]
MSRVCQSNVFDLASRRRRSKAFSRLQCVAPRPLVPAIVCRRLVAVLDARAMKRVAVFVAFALVALVRASFTLDNLDDVSLTRRQVAGPFCPEKIEFNTESNEIRAGDIQMEDKDCEGDGVITITPFGASVPTNASAAVRYFSSRSRDVGTFLVGSLNGGNIVCEAYNLTDGDELIFLRPNDDVDDVEWENVFGRETPLSRDDDDDFELDDDDNYLIVSDRCFFSETGLTDRVCFPADAQVRLQDGSVRRMDQLSIVDNVQVSQNSFSSLFAWTHADAYTKYRFVELVTEGGSIALTPSHYIYADGVVIAAGKVKTGMQLRSSDGSSQTVVEKKWVWKTGLYNPQTINGDIVVNDFVVTTYTTAVEPSMAHALLAPVRAAFSAVSNVFAVSQKSGL